MTRLESIPGPERDKLEKNVFLAPLADIWRDTRAYFLQRDPTPGRTGRAGSEAHAWRSCSAGIWDSPPTGPRMANVDPRDGLPGLVRPGHGRIQRMDCRSLPERFRSSAGWRRSPSISYSERRLLTRANILRVPGHHMPPAAFPY